MDFQSERAPLLEKRREMVMAGEPLRFDPLGERPSVFLKQRPGAPCVTRPNEEIDISHWPVGEGRIRGVGESGALQQQRLDSLLGEDVNGLMQELLES